MSWSSTSRRLARGFASVGGSRKIIDTLIIGGGPVGLSTAYHLAAHCRGNDGSGITIVERDPSYKRSSAAYSASGIRQQVSQSRGMT